jgi:hypothetical protein
MGNRAKSLFFQFCSTNFTIEQNWWHFCWVNWGSKQNYKHKIWKFWNLKVSYKFRILHAILNFFVCNVMKVSKRPTSTSDFFHIFSKTNIFPYNTSKMGYILSFSSISTKVLKPITDWKIIVFKKVNALIHKHVQIWAEKIRFVKVVEEGTKTLPKKIWCASRAREYFHHIAH